MTTTATPLRSPSSPRHALSLVIVTLLLCAPAWAALWTDRLGDFERQNASPYALPNAHLSQEYGIEAAERAEYKAGNRRFTATAYQTADSTGATALYQSLQPAGAKPSEFENKAVEEAFALSSVEANSTTVVQYQNYVMVFENDRPTWQVVKDYLGYAPNLGISTPPPLPGYLPKENRVPGTERYILGPESLNLYLPDVPAGIAAFSLGAEGQVAEYEADGNRLKLAILSYPTPQLARKKLEEYRSLGNPVLKREGTLIVFVASPSNRDFAERVVSLIRYRAAVTMNEKLTSPAEEFRQLIVNIVIMVAVLILLAAVAGIAFGGLRFLRRRNSSADTDDFLRLRID
ncbi:MAG: hypothetical protein IT170_03555 [Bryobacterales bacterium]|nr:hypothetical protein [Bryobacterales bacterium]